MRYLSSKPLQAKLKYIRLTPFEVFTEEGRAAERYRLAGLGAMATMLARFASIVLIVLTVRWAAPTLGTERFGVWATFSSLIAMLSFLDLGVGNALINEIAFAGASREANVRSVAMAGMGWLLTFGLASTSILVLTGYLLPWQIIFKLSTHSVAEETRCAAMIFGALFGLSLLSSGPLKVLIGLQRSYQAQLISLVSSICSIPALWLVIKFRPRVGAVLLAGFGLQSLIILGLSLSLLWAKGYIDVRIIPESMRRQRSKLLSTGSLYFMLQLGMMIGWGGDSLLIASFSGASSVAVFAVAQRLFQFASQPVSIFNSALWAAYADANARGDRRFLRETLRRSLTVSICAASALGLILLTTGHLIVPHWTKGTITVPWLLLLTWAIWTSIDAGGSALGTYLNGVGIVRAQVIVVITFCVVAIPAKIFGVSHEGPIGLMAATIACYLTVVIGLYGTVFRSTIMAPTRTQ